MRDGDLHPRAARYRAERLRNALSQLYLARKALSQLQIEYPQLDEILTEQYGDWMKLEMKSGERIEPRHRAKQPTSAIVPRPDHFLFLDECGSHVTGVRDSKFPTFCLSGIIVARDGYEALDVRWKAWKTEFLGSPNVVVHEPDVRHSRSKFRGSSIEHRQEIEAALNALLQELDFTCIAAAVDLEAFEALYPDSVVDDFLPASCYLMSIDFVLERFIHFLQEHGGARGMMIAESRGAKEDALVHAEFIRLHLEGTQYVSDSSFRAQLRPFVEFYRKARNSSGLQIADLAARPVAEKVRDSMSNPVRWETFKNKLYDGMTGSPHKYGLKVFPLLESNDPFPELPRKAKGSA